jgi:hypothetical protein
MDEGEAPTDGEVEELVKVPSLPSEKALIVFEPWFPTNKKLPVESKIKNIGPVPLVATGEFVSRVRTPPLPMEYSEILSVELLST